MWQNYFWWKILATWDFSKYLTLKKYLWKRRRIKMLVQKWFNFTVMTLAMQWALFLLKSEHVQKFYPYLYGHHAFRVYLSKMFLTIQKLELYFGKWNYRLTSLSISEILGLWVNVAQNIESCLHWSLRFSKEIRRVRPD